MLSNLDLGWLAGIIDGEGCFLATWTNQREKQPTVKTAIRVETCSLSMIERITNICDALNVQYRIEGPVFHKKSTRPVYKFVVNRAADVKKLLNSLHTNLTVKKSEALVILKWLERWPDQRRVGANKPSLSQKTAFISKIHQLKKIA